MSESQFKQFVSYFPDVMGKKFGQFSFEEGTYDHKTERGQVKYWAALAPKNYFLFDENWNIIKKGFKGINIGKNVKSEKDIINVDKLLTENELNYLGYEV